jgi:WD40 repeat protein
MHYPITSVCFSDTNELLFAAGNNHSILAWDIRANRVRFTLRGHLNTVTGITLSQDGTQLLSNAMDNKVRIWDVTPSVENTHRLRATLEGAVHGSELRLVRPAWSKDGSMIGAGSGDGTVILWNAYTHQIIYKHPSHKGSANAIDFHHTEPAGKRDALFFIDSLQRFTLDWFMAAKTQLTISGVPFFFSIMGNSTFMQFRSDFDSRQTIFVLIKYMFSSFLWSPVMNPCARSPGKTRGLFFFCTGLM